MSSADVTVVAGSQLSLSGGVTVSAGRTLAKKGDGVLDVSGGIEQSAGATMDVQAGVLSADRIRGGRLGIGSGALVSIKADGGLGGVSVVAGLHISGGVDAWEGRLELNDNDLIVQADGATRLDVLAEVSNQVRMARNSDPTRWMGKGIGSAAAAGEVNGLTGLAVILNAKEAGGALYTSFGGEPVDVDSILVKYTWNGDADLNGVVDANDYFRIDKGFAGGVVGQGPPYIGWFSGDFDYSGTVDANDYFLIDLAFVNQTGVLGGVPVAVPEPAGLVMMGAMGILVRRRMRRE